MLRVGEQLEWTAVQGEGDLDFGFFGVFAYEGFPPRPGVDHQTGGEMDMWSLCT